MPGPAAEGVLKAEGPTIVMIAVDPAEWRKLLPDQRQEFARWHIDRVLAGETSAISEWEAMGLKVALREWKR